MQIQVGKKKYVALRNVCPFHMNNSYVGIFMLTVIYSLLYQYTVMEDEFLFQKKKLRKNKKKMQLM